MTDEGQRLQALVQQQLHSEARAYLLRLYREEWGATVAVVDRLDVPRTSLYRWRRVLGVDEDAIRQVVLDRHQEAG